MSTRRALCAWAPLLRRCRTAGASGRGRGIGDGGSLGLVVRDCQRSLATSTLGVREGGGSSEARVWSRASFARSKFASGYTALAPKKLEQIMKIETVIFSPPEEITQIWNDYHIGRGHISAVMGSELYKVFEQRANECPLFVLPLRKGSGFISVVVQAQMPYMLFTALEDYRARGTEASPYFTVTHFTELVPTKSLVLVRGDIVFTSKLSDDEAETLLKTAHSFYINDERYRKVRKFNKDSREFDFKEVLQELNIPLQG
ncbi:hypothetical protein KC19_2G128600 [Ceratodon purpureus]|uniref:ATP synthase mitochondrial F1 complex assembly factor 1 n=1 Tax=Ceratodon purpureus TaxID=3225 RepID=A0A8T0IX56_CERPU|nr:hypothetical protein KC19_2G128600 [Ceratodon purpureus]